MFNKSYAESYFFEFDFEFAFEVKKYNFSISLDSYKIIDFLDVSNIQTPYFNKFESI